MTESVAGSMNGMRFFLPTCCLELLLEVDDRLEGAVAEQDGLGHHVLGQEVGAGLDHHDRVAGARDDQVEIGLLELRVRGVDHELAADASDADGSRWGPGTGSR